LSLCANLLNTTAAILWLPYYSASLYNKFTGWLLLKTDEKDLESVKSLICAQRSKWSASSDNKLKAAAKYFEYWEKKAGV
jgi:hypothetical protein